MSSFDDELAMQQATPSIAYDFQSELSDDIETSMPMITTDAAQDGEQVDEGPDGQGDSGGEASANGSLFVAEEDGDFSDEDEDYEEEDSVEEEHVVVEIPYMAPRVRAQYHTVDVGPEKLWVGKNEIMQYDEEDEVSKISIFLFLPNPDRTASVAVVPEEQLLYTKQAATILFSFPSLLLLRQHCP